MANFVPAPLVRQLLPGSAFLARLNKAAEPRTVTTSIVAGRDVLVQPIDSAVCPFGQSVVFEALGHVEMLFRPTVYRAIAVALATPVPPPALRETDGPISRVGHRSRGSAE